MNKKQISLTLGIVCIILTYAICVQLKTIDNIGTSTSVTFTENGLRDEVLRQKEKYDNLYRQLEEAEKNLEEVRKKSTENSTESTNMEEEIKLNNTLLGLTEVKGKGLVIILKDNPNVTLDTIISSANDFIVHDEDLKMIVNELKNSGAEAISINGERIVQTTSITCVGTVIQINNKRLNSPFEIKAIGNPESLYAVNRLGGYLDKIRSYVSVEVKKDNVEIPKYTGVFAPKYLQQVEE